MLQLIPVIEVYAYSDKVPIPEVTFQENPEAWYSYQKLCFEQAGFPDPMEPFEGTNSLFEVATITDNNLRQIVLQHTEALRNGTQTREQVLPFYGGCVLQQNGSNLLYPQCCGEISDFAWWKGLSEGEDTYYAGHPGPAIRFERETIVFDMRISDTGEEFVPPLEKYLFEINKTELARAVADAGQILRQLSQRAEHLMKNEGIHIEELGTLLLWENSERG